MRSAGFKWVLGYIQRIITRCIWGHEAKALFPRTTSERQHPLEDVANKVTLETVSEEQWQFSTDKMICWVGILSGGMVGDFSTPCLGSRKGSEGEGRKNNVRNLFQDLYNKKTYHSLRYTIASFYCQGVNSFLSFLAWFSLRLCFQPYNLINAELAQPPCSGTEDSAFMDFTGTSTLQTRSPTRKKHHRHKPMRTHQRHHSKLTQSSCFFFLILSKPGNSALWTNIHPGFPRKNTFHYYYFSALLSSFPQL